MPLNITISGVTYPIPVQGDSPPWGDELTNAISALASTLNTVVGSSDILTTSFLIANNQSSATNVVGLSFDPTIVRSAVVNYSIYRNTSLTELSECGVLLVTFKTVANSWEVASYTVGSSGVVFSMTTAGQIQYTSTNLSGTGYVGKMKFSAKAFLQA